MGELGIGSQKLSEPFWDGGGGAEEHQDVSSRSSAVLGGWMLTHTLLVSGTGCCIVPKKPFFFHQKYNCSFLQASVPCLNPGLQLVVSEFPRGSFCRADLQWHRGGKLFFGCYAVPCCSEKRKQQNPTGQDPHNQTKIVLWSSAGKACYS